MPPLTPRWPLTALLLTLSLGCQAVGPGVASRARPGPVRPSKATPKPSAPASTLAVSQRGAVSTLVGKARLIAHPGGAILSDQGGGVLSDQGGSILSDQGGAVISNNSGSILSDQGGAVISNNSGGIFGKTKFHRLLQASGGLGVYGLADAEIRLYDAAGRLIVDDAGKPLAATTGPDAAFKLQAVLPPGNLVARIQLWDGGELTAIVARGGAQQASLDLTTASSLGASYVLGLAQGQQAILDKLPLTESDRLNRELDVVRGFAKGAFKHEAATLDAITAKLRQRVPAVEKVAEDVRALLLGQAKLGEGRPATEVPLAGPVHLTIARSGRLVLGEQLAGRVRELQPDGTLAMLLDKTHGRIRNNAPTLAGLAEAPDGSLYAAVQGARRIYRIPSTGDIQAVFGSGDPGRDAPGTPTAMATTPSCLAVGPDGTLWVGEEELKGRPASRLLALRPDGRVEAFTPEGASGSFLGLAVAPSGEVYALLGPERGETGSLLRYRPGGGWTMLTSDLAPGRKGGVCVTAKGTVLVSDAGRGRVLSVQPDGTLLPLDGMSPGPALPGSLAAHPDGTLYISDLASNVVWEKRGEAPPRVVAGTAAVFQAGETQAFAINAPIGLAADDQGRIYIADSGSHTVKRFDGKALTVVAGSGRAEESDLGDGGPATQARLLEPRGLCWSDGSLYVLDNGHRRVRGIGPDGLIRTVASGPNLMNDWGLALDRDGRPWWSRAARGTLARLVEGGGSETVVGSQPAGGPNVGNMVLGLTGPLEADPAKLKMAMPTSIVRDPAGHMVFCDAIGGRIYRLRGDAKTTGTIELVAGVGLTESLARTEGLKAAGGPPSEEGIQARAAMLSVPLGLAFDAAGNLYVAEGGDRNLGAMAPLLGGEMPFDPAILPGLPPRVRRITPDGVITTVAGPGGKFFKDPEGEDALYVPASLVVTTDGRLAIGDLGSNLVRILPAGSY